MSKYTKHIILFILGLILLNTLASIFYIRWDLTSDKRYTLSKESKNLLNNIDQDVQIKVYLKGNFPLDFKRLEQETKQHLDELKIYNNHIHYRFINPKGIEEKLIKKGLQPSRLTVEEDGEISESLFFPWAIISYKNKSTQVPLLVNTVNGQEEQIQKSIENLEFAFSNGIHQVSNHKRKNIAILKGNGELPDIYVYDFLKSLQKKYNLAPFTIADAENKPEQLLKDLQKFDLCIIAKPTKPFSETQKLLLDQYIIHGKKTLWMIDEAYAEMDSLRATGEALFTPRQLNLTDLLFAYGVRINPNIVQDLYSSKIAVATGNVGGKTQFQSFLWPYYPLVVPNSNLALSKNIEAVNLKFPSSIDTLKNTIHKSILLESSPLTQIKGLPQMVSLSSIAEERKPDLFNHKRQLFGVLLEGQFISAYTNRTKTFKTDYKAQSIPNKMIVISDGDICSNQVLNGEPTRLDIDKWTGQHFGNKDFLLNAVDYLLDNKGLLSIRNKSLDIKLLNKEKISKEKGFWQFINIILPLLVLFLFGMVFFYIRKLKYTSK